MHLLEGGSFFAYVAFVTCKNIIKWCMFLIAPVGEFRSAHTNFRFIVRH